MTSNRQSGLVSRVLCGLMVFVLGCGTGESTSTATGTPSAKEALTDLVNMLTHFKSENKPPPARMADIQPVEPLFQGAYLGLVRDEIVYIWGTQINPSASDKVLAYEKAVETGSGWVLMQDGSLKTMESGEFKAAPKAAK